MNFPRDFVFPGALAASLLGVPSALADTVTSANWSAYAVHRAGVRFAQVTSAGSSFTVSFLGASPGPAGLPQTGHLVHPGASFLPGAR